MPSSPRGARRGRPRRFGVLVSALLVAAVVAVVPPPLAPLAGTARADGASISGTVSGPDGPLEGASISTCADSGEYCGSAVTGPDGTYTTEPLPPAVYRVRVAPPFGSSLVRGIYQAGNPGNYAAWGSGTPVPVDADAVTGIDVTLPVGVAITGRLVGPQAEPVSDATILACADEDCWSGRSDGDGILTVPGLPSGSYQLRITPASGRYFSGSYSGEAPGHFVRTADGSMLDVADADVDAGEIVVPTGLAITGTVDGSDGLPVDGMTVEGYCQPDEGDPCVAATVLADGSYVLAPFDQGQRVVVRVRPPDGSLLLDGYYALGSAGGFTPSKGSATVLTVGESDTTGIDLVLARGHSIAGRITGAGDAAVPGATIRACIGSRCVEGTTDPDGSYVTPVLPDGSARVQVVPAGEFVPGWYAKGAPGNYRASLLDSTAVVISGADRAGIDMTLPGGATITGTILGGEGESAAGARVQACSDAEVCGSAEVAEDGTYTLTGLVPDAYQFWVEPLEGSMLLMSWYRDGAPGNAVADWPDSTRVAVGAEGAGVDMTLPRGHAVRGTVVDEGGQPVPYARIEAMPAAGGSGASDLSDADGVFAAQPLRDGEYIVRVSAEGHASGYIAPGAPGNFTGHENEAGHITVDGADAAPVVVALPAGRTVSGTLTGPDGEPASGFGVRLLDAPTGAPCAMCAYAETDDTGAWSMTGTIPDGDWYLQATTWAGPLAGGFHGPDAVTHYTADRTEATTIHVDGDLAGVDMRLPAGHAISGTITGPGSDTPIAGASVTLCETTVVGGVVTPLTSPQCTDTVAAHDGTYSIGNWLRDGPYIVTVTRPNGSRVRNGYYFRDPAHPQATYTRRVADATPVVLAGADRTGIDVTLPAGFTISGRITYADHTPILGATAYTCSGSFSFGAASMRPMNTSSGFCTYAEFDDHGNYHFVGLESGSYKVMISGPGGVPIAAGRQARGAEVTPMAAAGSGTWYCNGALVAVWSDSCAVTIEDADVALDPIEVAGGTPVRPALEIAAPAATRSASVTFALTFDGPVTGLDAEDITLAGTANGCSAGAPTGAGAAWSVVVSGCGEGTLTVRVGADTVTGAGGATGPATAVERTVVIDRTRPVITGAPAVRLASGASVSAGLVPARITWAGSDGKRGSGIARYQLERTVDNGRTWSAPVTVAATSVTSRVSATRTVRYRVRALDAAGNTGAWAAGSSRTIRVLQTGTAAAPCGSRWKSAVDARYSGGSTRYATTRGAAVTCTFTGRAIALVTTMGPGRGVVRISVDGAAARSIDLGTGTRQWRWVAWRTAWGATGTHTIRITVAGSAGRPRFDLDALVVMR